MFVCWNTFGQQWATNIRPVKIDLQSYWGSVQHIRCHYFRNLGNQPTDFNETLCMCVLLVSDRKIGYIWTCQGYWNSSNERMKPHSCWGASEGIAKFYTSGSLKIPSAPLWPKLYDANPCLHPLKKNHYIWTRSITPYETLILTEILIIRNYI